MKFRFKPFVLILYSRLGEEEGQEDRAQMRVDWMELRHYIQKGSPGSQPCQLRMDWIVPFFFMCVAFNIINEVDYLTKMNTKPIAYNGSTEETKHLIRHPIQKAGHQISFHLKYIQFHLLLS